jgi:flagellar export protein FliJ
MSKNSLKTLIRLSKWAVDDCQRVLAQLIARETEILAAIDGHHKLLEQEKQVAAADPAGVGVQFSHFVKPWTAHLEALHRALDEIRRMIVEAQENLAEAYRQQKSREQVQAARDQREQEEAARKERAALDEIGLNQHRRRNDDTA